MNEIKRLQKAIRDLHGVGATHLRSEPVREVFRGEVAWEGVMEIFALRGHPKAGLAYAWSHETDDGRRRYVAVLGLPPIASAADAVRASVAAEASRGGRR